MDILDKNIDKLIRPEYNPPVLEVNSVDAGIFYGSVAGPALKKWAEIKRLGLESHIAELEVLGYTVVLPDKLASRAYSDKLLQTVLAVGRRNGLEIDMESDGVDAQFGIGVQNLLLEDDIFIEAALNPVLQALVTYLVGEHGVLGNYTGIFKGRAHKEELPLHVDETRAPPPFAAHPQFANATWILTDYSQSKGSVYFVPGSHHYCRAPVPGEGEEERVPIEAPAGSLILWTGRTWHGAYVRTEPGLRACMIMPFYRPHLRPQENFREHVTPEQLRKYPGLEKTLGMKIGNGWNDGNREIYGAASHAMGRHVYD